MDILKTGAHPNEKMNAYFSAVTEVQEPSGARPSGHDGRHGTEILVREADQSLVSGGLADLLTGSTIDLELYMRADMNKKDLASRKLRTTLRASKIIVTAPPKEASEPSSPFASRSEPITTPTSGEKRKLPFASSSGATQTPVRKARK